MTVFIPAMLAVLLAEIGRGPVSARQNSMLLAASALGVAVGVSAAAGYAIAPTVTPHARSLILAVALFLTGAGQFGRRATTPLLPSWRDAMRQVWRSGAPFLAFAFAVWRAAPLGAAGGALAGSFAAILLGIALPARHVITTRRLAGGTLIAAALYAAVWALRLV